MPLNNCSDAGEVWRTASLQDSCTVQALLCSDRSLLQKWTLSLAVLAMASTHLKVQALRWAQGSREEPAGTAGAVALGGAAVAAASEAASAAEPGAATAGAAPEAAPGAAPEAAEPACTRGNTGGGCRGRGRAPAPAKRQKLDDGSDIGSQAPAPPAHKVVDILVESAEDVPVVEVCLRFAYMGTEALAESHSQGLPQLLAVYKQADYLGMSSCCKAVLEAAAQLKPEAMGIDDAVRAWGGIIPDRKQLRQLCTTALLYHLGDMLLVMRVEELLKQFLALPLPAVLALLDSSDLATGSEDLVVAAMGCWVDHNEPTDGETKQLADRSMTLSKQDNALYVYVHTNTPQRTTMVDRKPAWRLQCGLSWQVPGGAPGDYRGGWRNVLPGGKYSDATLRLSAGKSVTNISDIEEHLLIRGRLRLKLEVSACSAV